MLILAEVSNQKNNNQKPVPTVNKTASKKETKKDSEQVIYCGPSLPGGVLFQHAVFLNGVPDHIDLEKYPTIEKLFIPVSQLNEFEQRLSQTGSAEQAFFHAVKEEMKAVK